MSSFVLNRRVLLGGVTLFGVSSLLAACGQQANNEASTSSSATDAASAAPRSTASVATSESPSASATPSTVRGYSGGSKAPEGEYRKADKYGPAQNVPKPNAPEDGYREKSIEGIRKTMDAWIKWGNYGVQTGDYSMARQFISPTFEIELKEYDDIEELYRRGGWVIDGVENMVANEPPWSEDGETYFWKVYREWNREIYVEYDGSWRGWNNDDKSDDTFKYEFKYNGIKWEIMGYEGVDK